MSPSLASTENLVVCHLEASRAQEVSNTAPFVFEQREEFLSPTRRYVGEKRITDCSFLEGSHHFLQSQGLKTLCVCLEKADLKAPKYF